MVTLGVLLGAWLGATTVPLDWDVWWQVWPICGVWGVWVGLVLSSLIAFALLFLHGLPTSVSEAGSADEVDENGDDMDDAADVVGGDGDVRGGRE